MIDKPNDLAEGARLAGPGVEPTTVPSVEDASERDESAVAAGGPGPDGLEPDVQPDAVAEEGERSNGASSAAGSESTDMADNSSAARRPTDSVAGPAEEVVEASAGDIQPQEEAAEEVEAPEEEEAKKDWYILKVQSNRENSIADALQRRVAIEGLDCYFGQIVVPTEKVTEFKGGKKRVIRRKLYPGYILVQMAINDQTWFLVRETPGIGDFTGSGGKPTPMLPHEVQRIVSKQEERTDETPTLKVKFNVGDRVKINEGTFENFEGEVSDFDPASGRVTVMINIFGRSTPVELEYWQIGLV